MAQSHGYTFLMVTQKKAMVTCLSWLRGGYVLAVAMVKLKTSFVFCPAALHGCLSLSSLFQKLRAVIGSSASYVKYFQAQSKHFSINHYAGKVGRQTLEIVIPVVGLMYRDISHLGLFLIISPSIMVTTSFASILIPRDAH